MTETQKAKLRAVLDWALAADAESDDATDADRADVALLAVSVSLVKYAMGRDGAGSWAEVASDIAEGQDGGISEEGCGETWQNAIAALLHATSIEAVSLLEI